MIHGCHGPFYRTQQISALLESRRYVKMAVPTKTSSPKGNDRSPDNKQVFLNSSQVSKRFFQLDKGS